MSKQEIGKRHRQARESLGMNVPDYAVAMGVKTSTVYSWESGRTSVPQEVLAELEQRYGISAGWILTGEQGADKKPALSALQQQLQSLQNLVLQLKTETPDVIAGASNSLTLPRIPLLSLGVSAGLPVEAEDTIEKEIDLVEMLLEHPDSTYFIRVVGDSMTNAGISDGDTLIVDCSIQPKSGQIVIARVYGELTVKRYLTTGQKPILRAENSRYRDILITQDMDFSIIGVVRSCIKKL